MKTLLRIDSSIRMHASVSRAIGNHFVTCWLRKYPDGKIISRDLQANPVPHLTESTFSAFFNRDVKNNGLVLSDELIEEINQCDSLLITCPMYNFQIPSSLKAYLDHIVRSNKTFQYREGKYIGMLEKKKCFIVTTMGGKNSGTILEEGFKTYLRNIFSFIGIKDVVMFSVEGTTQPGFDMEVLNDVKRKITNSLLIQ